MSMYVHKNYVNGKFMDNKTGKRFSVVNPATGEEIYQMEKADEYILNAAVESAKKGFQIWSAMDATQRSRILRKAVSILQEKNDELARIEVLDTGKPLQEAAEVDVITGAEVIEFFAGIAPGIEGCRQDLGRDFYYTRREPLGVCAGRGVQCCPGRCRCGAVAHSVPGH